MSTRELTNAKIKYLVLMHTLDPNGRGLRSVVIAKTLHITRASVHTMVEKLCDIGCAEKEYYGLVYLTEKGVHVAEHYAPMYRKEMDKLLYESKEIA